MWRRRRRKHCPVRRIHRRTSRLSAGNKERMSLRVWPCPADMRRLVRLRLRLWSPKTDRQLGWLFGKYDLSCRSILIFWEFPIGLLVMGITARIFLCGFIFHLTQVFLNLEYCAGGLMGVPEDARSTLAPPTHLFSYGFTAPTDRGNPLVRKGGGGTGGWCRQGLS